MVFCSLSDWPTYAENAMAISRDGQSGFFHHFPKTSCKKTAPFQRRGKSDSEEARPGQPPQLKAGMEGLKMYLAAAMKRAARGGIGAGQ